MKGGLIAMQITYLGHSGFLVYTGSCALLFDYYTGRLPELPPDTVFYVFVSHRHYDHYSYKIFELWQHYREIRYIISDDLGNKIHRQYLQKKAGAGPEIMERITFIKPDQNYTCPHLEVRTTDSTDLGVAFLVSLVSGPVLFHAGDLNWWTWPEEETEAEYQDMTSRFKKEVAKLADSPVDLAFLPLDPRQLDRFYWGFDYYMRHVDIQAAVPMHFWQDFPVIDKLLQHEVSDGYRDKVIRLKQEGETFTI